MVSSSSWRCTTSSTTSPRLGVSSGCLSRNESSVEMATTHTVPSRTMGETTPRRSRRRTASAEAGQQEQPPHPFRPQGVPFEFGTPQSASGAVPAEASASMFQPAGSEAQPPAAAAAPASAYAGGAAPSPAASASGAGRRQPPRGGKGSRKGGGRPPGGGPPPDDEDDYETEPEDDDPEDDESGYRRGWRRSGGGGGADNLRDVETWDGKDPSEYRVWKKRVRVWSLSTKLGKTKQGSALLLKLKGDAWKVVENIPEQALVQRDGLEVVLQTLDKVYQDEPEVDLVTRMGEFMFDESMLRKGNELMAEYCSRVLAKHDKLLALEAGLPDIWVGFLLQHRALLDSDDRRGLLNYTRGDLGTEIIAKGLKRLADQKRMDQKTKDYLRRAGGHDRSHGRWRPGRRHVMEAGAEDHTPHESSDEESDEDAVVKDALQALHSEDGDQSDESVYSETEVRDALAAWKDAREKLKMKAKNRGFNSLDKYMKDKPKDPEVKKLSYRVDIEQLKKQTRCRNCKEVGHWHRECPQRRRDHKDKGNRHKEKGDKHARAGAAYRQLRRGSSRPRPRRRPRRRRSTTTSGATSRRTVATTPPGRSSASTRH